MKVCVSVHEYVCMCGLCVPGESMYASIDVWYAFMYKRELCEYNYFERERERLIKEDCRTNRQNMAAIGELIRDGRVDEDGASCHRSIGERVVAVRR